MRVSATSDGSIDLELWKQDTAGADASNPSTNIHVKGTLAKCG